MLLTRQPAYGVAATPEFSELGCYRVAGTSVTSDVLAIREKSPCKAGALLSATSEA